jgi:glucose-6-phosphate isomerase
MSNLYDSLLPCGQAWLSPGCCDGLVRAGLAALQQAEAAPRMWEGDGTLWANPPHLTEVENRLGWLDLPAIMPMRLPRLRDLAEKVRRSGIKHVVLLGMGGSSLAPEVMCRVVGITPGFPALTVLDATDPAQIRGAVSSYALPQTLFVVASKSGSTTETDNLYAYFREQLEPALGMERWQDHFVAITDPGTTLETEAVAQRFLARYANPADIGGRYSALSFFGLVPAALMGLEMELLLQRARRMAETCGPTVAPEGNPGLVLGALLGEAASAAEQPRDKLTLLCSPRLAPFGVWVEQLVAESTGKDGKGILPVEGEPLLPVASYGHDRLFVALRLDGDANDAVDAQVRGLIAAGHAVVVLRWGDVYDVGAEFLRWEVATAVACQRLGVNPFDQPNVEASKKRTKELLDEYESTRTLRSDSSTLAAATLPASALCAALRRFLGDACAPQYVALMAYVERGPATEAALQEMRTLISTRLGVAATVGFGPRFLHSTGQLHKGGPQGGLFVQITRDDEVDMDVPGEAYSFGVLKQAQALGDADALREERRRVMRINIGPDLAAGLGKLWAALAEALHSEGR